MNKFFVSTPFGFEAGAAEEMKAVWPHLLGKDALAQTSPVPEVTLHEGGFEFEADLFVALQLNFFLKTANRVLLRMGEFKARDLPKFYNKFKTLPWSEFLHNSNVEWEVAAQTSRLNNEKRIQESAEKALSEIFGKPTGTEVCGRIYIRMVDDLCTVSLDTTGEHLHKRGWAILKGPAPLRETIAAFMIRQMMGASFSQDLSSTTLLDPMMGSGTLLTEALALGSGQFARSYAFQKWKKAPKLFLSPSCSFNYKLNSSSFFKCYRGFDIEESMLVIAEKNFLEAQRQIRTAHKNLPVQSDYQFTALDSLRGDKGGGDGPVWLVVNPPYGERLPESIKGGVRGLVKNLCDTFAPVKFGVLYPEKEKVVAPSGYRWEKEFKISNGGIRCMFTILTRM